ncbi:WD40 repeat-like protein [Suillus decipiens]|nr:WD40 repeat-like protein [Suillus decipiens]
MAALIPNTTPIRTFEDHGDRVIAVAALPDEHMVTASYDGMLRLWDLKTGFVLRKMEGHRSRVRALAVSPERCYRDWVASGDESGELIIWNGKTGELLNQAIKVHDGWIFSLDFSSNSTMLASGSSDTTTKLWCTSTWEVQYSLSCGGIVRCVRYSPISSSILAIATDNSVQIYDVNLYASNRYHHNDYGYPVQLRTTVGGEFNYSLAWTRDGSRLISGGSGADPTIREYDTTSEYWQEVGNPWKGHFKDIHAISLNSSGTLLASASHDNHVRLWRRSDQRAIAIFKHSREVNCVTFSADDKHILSGGVDKKISEWSISKDAALPEDGLKDSLLKEQGTHQAIRNACIVGDWPAAEKVLNLDIETDANHTCYANRAFVMARKCDWDKALQDAIRSVSIQPSLVGHISKGIALCGKKQAIALFNAGEHQEAMLRIGELAACPNVDPIACRIVEAYLRVQLGNMALDGARYNEAVEHFTAAANASIFFYKLPIQLTYDEFIALFGLDLKSLCQTANQQQCYALFRAGSFGAAIESYQSIMNKTDEDMKVGLHAWFNGK